MDISKVAVWVGVIGSILALGKQGYDIIKNRRKDKAAVEEALDRAPYVREQLALGNVGDAVKHLNEIIQSQADHIASQNERISACDHEITLLKRREQELEDDSESWKRKYFEVEARHRAMIREIADLRQLVEMHNTIINKNPPAARPGDETENYG